MMVNGPCTLEGMVKMMWVICVYQFEMVIMFKEVLGPTHVDGHDDGVLGTMMHP